MKLFSLLKRQTQLGGKIATTLGRNVGGVLGDLKRDA